MVRASKLARPRPEKSGTVMISNGCGTASHSEERGMRITFLMLVASGRVRL